MTPTLAAGGSVVEIMEAEISPSAAKAGNGELIYMSGGSGSSTTGTNTTGSSTAGSNTTGTNTTGSSTAGSNTTNSGIIEAALTFKDPYN
jgi:hypothetical protein